MRLEPRVGAGRQLLVLNVLWLLAITGCGQQHAQSAPPPPPDELGLRPAAGAPSQRALEHAPGRVLVKLAPASAANARGLTARGAADDAVLAKVRSAPGVKDVRRIFAEAKSPALKQALQAPSGDIVPAPDLSRWHEVELREGEDVQAKIAELKSLPGVAVVEPDYLRRPAVVPGSATDPLYDQQWHLAAARVPEAWAHLESLGLPPGGSRDVVVAVIDTGIDLTHPDLAANLWTNGADGSHGFDAITHTNVPQDDHGHGTHVAGIIAAQGANGQGGVGVAYNAQLMAIKAAQYSGVLAASDIAEGIYFAVEHGADVINMSFGGYGKSTLEEDALAVAFGQAVLVAAAGNDGIANDAKCDPFRARTMYPAGYDWVLGVMASSHTPNADGGYLASFSNYDCIPGDTKEYEVMAPGVGLWSTLPGAQYAAWSGTSMSAPLVSGIAALVRSRFADKDVYSSRFVMGQVASTGGLQVAYTPERGTPVSFNAADAVAAISTVPEPHLAYVERWVFDPLGNGSNDADGALDAGETVDLAIVIRNRWGRADNVVVKIEPTAVGAVSQDPYVTMIVDTVNYGAVGSFASDDNGLQYDATGAAIGVSSPFRFSVDARTPNGHIVPFRVTMTASNGLDAVDTRSYAFESRFELKVTNGRVLPRIISEDTTLTPDALWIVNRPTLVEAGKTLVVMPGAKVLFMFQKTDAAYQDLEVPSIHVQGVLSVVGTAEDPVELLVDDNPGCTVIDQSQVCAGVRIINAGVTELRYARIQNPLVGFSQDYFGYTALVSAIDHCRFEWVGFGSGAQHWGVAANDVRSSIFSELRPSSSQAKLWAASVSSSLFDNVRNLAGWDTLRIARMQSSVALREFDISLWYMSNQGGYFVGNAILNPYAHLDPGGWMRVRATANEGNCYGMPIDASSNYWGTASTDWIDVVIRDYYDNFSCPKITYQPILVAPPEAAYPFVVDVDLMNSAGHHAATLGAEDVRFDVSFNRDMDVSVVPQVSFGPAEPFTDYTVRGAWRDARTWSGSFQISPLTGDGHHFVRVAGARAADDPWLVSGNDVGRFQFEIITSGTESMNLQAVGGEGRVDLSWTQNDFDLLAGYNLYRSTSATGQFTRVNQTIIPLQMKAFRDTSVSPGQRYFYRFTVVKTDMTESQPSNVATATPLDTIAPVITHAPVTTAPPGLALSVSAQVTDNVAVASVSLSFRRIGEATYTTRAMTRTTASTYVATIEGSAVASPGVEYYLTATDGITTVSAGRPEYPYQVVVVDRPIVTTLSPLKGPASGGTAVTIAGTNFKPGATVTFGGAIASGVTVVSSSRIDCTTPPSIPTAVDVRVTNPDGQNGALLRGFTFESDAASLSLPTVTEGRYAVIQVPINASVEGLVAADLTVTFDPAVLSARAARAGALTSGWTVVSNTGTAGQIRVSMASAGGAMAGSGVLATLEFEVVGAPASSTPLTLSSAVLNGGAVPFTAAHGAVHVQAVCSVSGAARLWSSGAPIPAVQLQLAGERLYSAQTDASGSYSVAGVPPGAYTLRPSKEGGADGITAYDASLILQHAAGLHALSGYAAVAGDLDKSGSIDSMDAFYVLQRAAGLIALPFPGAGVTWEFTPPTRTYSLTTSVAGQDFTGVLLGDPSGNASGQDALAQGGALAQLRVTELPPQSDGSLGASVELIPNGNDVYSLDLVLVYNPALGTPTLVGRDAASQDWLMTFNVATPGEIRVSMAGALPIVADGVVLALSFATSGSAQDVALAVRTASLNEALPADVEYWLTMEHAVLAARMAAGIVTPSQAQLAKYDVAPLVSGGAQRDGLVDIEDAVIILRKATGSEL